jgi:DNA-binding HxlR family transcriptional regulator
MKWDDLSAQPCSVSRALAVVGDRWTLMILRDCFLGVRRFEASSSGWASRAPSSLTACGCWSRRGCCGARPISTNPPRHEYRLTAKGLDLHPVIMAVAHFGDAYYAGEAGPPVLRRHKGCGCDFHPVQVCSECGEAVTARQVEVRAGRGFRSPS